MNNASTTHDTLLDNLGSNEPQATIPEINLSKVTASNIEITANEFTNEIATSNLNITTLILLRNTIEEATSVNDFDIPTNRLSEMMTNRTIHNEVDALIAEQESNDTVDAMTLLKSDMDTLRQDTEVKIIECNGFPANMRTGGGSSTP